MKSYEQEIESILIFKKTAKVVFVNQGMKASLTARCLREQIQTKKNEKSCIRSRSFNNFQQ